ncbi:hypothetical protein MferCBS31731_003045 [Microsporum ferrugineum]
MILTNPVFWLAALGLHYANAHPGTLALAKRAQPIDAKIIHVFNSGKMCPSGTQLGQANMSNNVGTVNVKCSYERHSYDATIALYPGRLTGNCCYVPDQDVFLFVQDQRTEPLTNFELDSAQCCNEASGETPTAFIRETPGARCSYGSLSHSFPSDFNQDLVTKCCWSAKKNEWTVHLTERQKHKYFSVPLTQKIKTMDIERADFYKSYMELTVSVTWAIPVVGGSKTNRQTIRFDYGKDISNNSITRVEHHLGWYAVTTTTKIGADGTPEFLLHWDSWLFAIDIGRHVSTEKGTNKIDIPANSQGEIKQFLLEKATVC